jgi:hypothetical protein
MPSRHPNRAAAAAGKGIYRSPVVRPAFTKAPAARGRYAALRGTMKAKKIGFASAATDATHDRPTTAYAEATLFLADTLGWLSLWQDNADNEHWLDDDFSAKQDRYFPQP